MCDETVSLIYKWSFFFTEFEFRNPGKGVVPSPHLGVVAIEKGAFGSPSTKVRNFT